MDRLKYDNALFVQECRKRARFGSITQAEAIDAFWVVAQNYTKGEVVRDEIPDDEMWADEGDFITDTLAANGIRVVADPTP